MRTYKDNIKVVLRAYKQDYVTEEYAQESTEYIYKKSRLFDPFSFIIGLDIGLILALFLIECLLK